MPSTITVRPLPLTLGALAMAAALLWAGWSYTQNIARISQGDVPVQQGVPAKAWSDTLA